MAMPLAARRTFRFGGVVALALLLAYGLGAPLPFIAPVFAVLLSAAPTPPMPLKLVDVFLWILLLGIYIGSKSYGVSGTGFAASFWINVLVTLLILLGPAVEDSAGGKDVYKAFAMRFGLFVAITFYAWLSILALEWLRQRHTKKRLMLP